REPHVIVSEADEVEANAIKLLEQVTESYGTAVQPEFPMHRPLRPPQPAPLGPDELFIDWDATLHRLSQATRVAELGLDDDAAAPVAADPGALAALPSRHIRCQPAVELKGRVADWVTEIKARRDDGETSLFVAATTGRAERAIELLKERDIFAIPVERAEDAR